MDKHGSISTIYEGDITSSKIVYNVESIIQNNEYDNNIINKVCYDITGFV